MENADGISRSEVRMGRENGRESERIREIVREEEKGRATTKGLKLRRIS